MTFGLWMILVAMVLPLVTTAMAKGGGAGYDNRAPRHWAETLRGWRARADWAHRNHMEAFAPFAASVLVAHWAHGPQGLVDGLAGLFVLARLGYTAAYITDRAALRSILWAVGFLCDVGLMCSGLLGPGSTAH